MHPWCRQYGASSKWDAHLERRDFGFLRRIWIYRNWPGTILSRQIPVDPVQLGNTRKHLRFTGIICSIHYNKREYRLATYKGARIKTWSEHGAEVIQRKYRLLVEVLEKHGQPLRAPVEGAMGRIIHESLCSKVRYRFWENGHLLFDYTDDGASFEYSEKTNAQWNNNRRFGHAGAFFLVFRRSNCKYFVNKRYISLKVVLKAPFETG